MAALTGLTINDTGFLQPASGTGSQRIGGTLSGAMRYNSDLSSMEISDGSALLTSWSRPQRQNLSLSTNGLILCFDARIPGTYAGTGTTAYNLKDQNNLYTSSGFTNPTYTSDSVTQSFAFNGTNTAFVSPEYSAFNTQTLTIEVWVKTNALSQNGFFFEKGNVNTQYSLFQGGGTVYFRTVGSDISNNPILLDLTFPSSTYLNTTQWHHIVATYTGGDKRIYVNGNIVARDTTNNTIRTNTNGQSIGVYGGFNGTRDYYYNGNISVVRVYNRALSMEEVQRNYNLDAGNFGRTTLPSIVSQSLVQYCDAALYSSYPNTGTTWYDLTGNGHNLTMGSGVSLVAQFGGVMQFIQNNTGVATNSSLNLSSSNYTVIGFARKLTDAGTGRTFTANSNNWLLGHWSSLVNQYYAEGWVNSPNTASDTTWRMFAGTGNILSDVYQIYSNATLLAQNSNGSAGPYGWNLCGAYGEYSSAQIANLLVYNRVLSAEEITQNFTALRGRFGI